MMQNFLICSINIKTSDKSKHIQDIQGRQLETCILHEFRSFNSKTQIQADHHQMVTLLVCKEHAPVIQYMHKSKHYNQGIRNQYIYKSL